MTGFDLIVRIFGLLLGFAIAEALGGFARTLRLKLGLTPVPAEATKVGWLVPLLGLLVVMDQMSFWLAFYVLQAHIPLSYLTMLAMLVLIGGFYLVSTMVFPASPQMWADFDDYYLRVKGAVIGGVLAVNVAILAFGAFVLASGGSLEGTGRSSLTGSLAELAFLPILAALLATRRRRLSLVFLVLANAALVTEALTLSR